MRLVTFVQAGQQYTGLLFADRIMPLTAAAKSAGIKLDTSSVLAIIRSGAASLAALRQLANRASELESMFIASSAVQLLAPIPQPVRNAFCVGRNYLDHIKEGQADKSQ